MVTNQDVFQKQRHSRKWVASGAANLIATTLI